MKLTFEWDEFKAIANCTKHKVRFEDGKTIFNDPFLFTFRDVEHSMNEERYISIGLSVNGHILVLTHTERRNRIRIIKLQESDSARKEIL